MDETFSDAQLRALVAECVRPSVRKAKEESLLPGPKKKQAEALFRNVNWLCDKFGPETVGMLTMTCGDFVDGRFVKVKERAEASRRFNSIMTHVIRGRYRCGVTVQERHDDDGIHFHIVTTAGADIKTGFDYAKFDTLQKEVKAGQRKGWRAVECGANDALRDEWKFWRSVASRFGFGRCQILPMRKNGEAMGRYVAKYISKTWDKRSRNPDDKGARLVRYFGKWETVDQEKKIVALRASRGDFDRPNRCSWVPPHSARFGRMTANAIMWRECARQVQKRCELDGITFTQETVKIFAGRKWGWHWTKAFNATVFMSSRRLAPIVEDWQEWERGVLDEFGGRTSDLSIAGKDRGAGFWQFNFQNDEPDYELNRQRAENNRLLEIHAGIAECADWAMCRVELNSANSVN